MIRGKQRQTKAIPRSCWLRQNRCHDNEPRGLYARRGDVGQLRVACNLRPPLFLQVDVEQVKTHSDKSWSPIQFMDLIIRKESLEHR